MHERYESPTLTKVGSVRDLTLGEGILGSDDNFVFHIGRITIDIPYGHGS
ncbi:MAG TPA: lasso RiPP family leader peptide-containing protein [Nocardioides sp.]|nr:lasso RiPP family leader peptide-containing protein [Nocardioides sp.]